MYPKVYVISVSVRSIAGRHKMTEEDYGLPAGTLPPEDLATLGNLITVDPDLLLEPEALRKRTNRVLENGVKVASGAVFTEGQLKETLDDLQAIQKDYEAAIQTIVDNFEDSLDQRTREHTEYADLIRKYAPDVNYVKRRMSYHINVYKLAVPVDDPHASILADTLNRSDNDITKRLIEEVAEFAVKFHKASFEKTKKLVKQSVGTLRRKLLPKVQSFSLLDASLKPVWVFLDAFVQDVISTIDAKPKGEACIEGPDLAPFEARIQQVMTTKGIKSLLAAPSQPTNNVLPNDSQPPPEPAQRPLPVNPLQKRPEVSDSSRDERRPLRRVSF